MINYYKRSIKAFKEFVKKDPSCTKAEYDKYAQDNCLFCSNTLMFHLFHDDLVNFLNKKNINNFEYLKSMFLLIPAKYRSNKVFSTFLKMQKVKTKEKIAGGYTNDR